MSFASDYQARETARIARLGELLTVTRRPSSIGGAVTTQSVYFIPEALNTNESSQFYAEGVFNSNETNPQRFICAGDADVQEAIDRITYGGAFYRVANVNPGARVSGVNINQHCYAAREGLAE